MVGAASQAGDSDSSRAHCLTSGLQGSVNVHRGALLLVPQWRCISSFVFYILVTLVPFAVWSWKFSSPRGVRHKCYYAKSRKYQGVFEVKIRVKTWQVRGIWSQHWSISKSQNGGRNQVSGRVSAPCWHATHVANVPWKPLNSVKVTFGRSFNRWRVFYIYAFFLVCCDCDTSYIVSVHIQCQASIHTLSLCRGH